LEELNGPEFRANALRDGCRFTGAGISYIEPGAPWQNTYVESFDGRQCDELLAVETPAACSKLGCWSRMAD